MQAILDEFCQVYDRKLGEIKAGNENDQSLQKKVDILEDFVDKLKDQNQCLVDTVQELENEANTRVRMLETLLQKTANNAKEYMVHLKDFEEEMRGLHVSKAKSRKKVENLQKKMQKLEEERVQLQEHNDNLNHDLNSLIRLVSYARNTGRWDVGNLSFCEVSFEQVFGSPVQLSETSSCEDLQTAGKMEEIADEYPPLRGCGTSSNATSCSGSYPVWPDAGPEHRQIAQQQESEPPITDRDLTLMKLSVDLKYSNRARDDLQLQLLERDRTIADLQVQITDLRHQLSLQFCENHLTNAMEDDRNSAAQREAMQQLGALFQQMSADDHQRGVATTMGTPPCADHHALSIELEEERIKVECLERELAEKESEFRHILDAELKRAAQRIQAELGEEKEMIKQTRDENNSLKRRMEELTKRLYDRDSTVKRLSLALEENASESEEWRAERTELVSLVARLQCHVEGEQQRRETMERDMARKGQTISRLEQDLAQMNRTQQQVLAERRQLKEQAQCVPHLDSILQQMRGENVALRRDLEERVRENEDQRVTIRVLQDALVQSKGGHRSGPPPLMNGHPPPSRSNGGGPPSNSHPHRNGREVFDI